MKTHFQSNNVADNTDPTLWHVCYLLQALGYVTVLTWIAAFIIAVVKRRDVWHNELLYSHATWQIRTFGYAILWSLLAGVLFWSGLITLFIGIGFILMVIGVGLGIFNFIWVIYRIAYGWVKLYDHKPAPIKMKV